ncbi:hypothetical protein [Saliniramus fredricksonii]|nr:hypothetical protein [Saliniramus fredricksonii]
MLDILRSRTSAPSGVFVRRLPRFSKARNVLHPDRFHLHDMICLTVPAP